MRGGIGCRCGRYTLVQAWEVKGGTGVRVGEVYTVWFSLDCLLSTGEYHERSMEERRNVQSTQGSRHVDSHTLYVCTCRH